MKQPRKNMLRAFQATTVRHIRDTPNYLFLLWRWSTWFYAAIIIINFRPRSPQYYAPTASLVGYIFLSITLVQTIISTLYAPVFQVYLPNLLRLGGLSPTKKVQRRAQDDNDEELMPLTSSPNKYFTMAVYALDVILCAAVVYFTGPNGGEPYFGVSSPFHRYGLSTALAASFAYGYSGAIYSSIGYDLIVAFGIFVRAPGTPAYYHPNVLDIFGSLFDTPFVALIAAAFASVLISYAQSKRREQDNARRQSALVRVSETLAKGAPTIKQLLDQSAKPIRLGGHFQRLMIAQVNNQSSDEENHIALVEPIVCDEVEIDGNDFPDDTVTFAQRVIQSGNRIDSFELLHDNSNYGIARLYLPLYKDGQMQLILGAENIRQTRYGEKQEEFLTITGAQLLVALDNIRLAEETIELNAAAERSRIAREIHDGIAQLVYMMSLNAETCATLAHRMTEDSDEGAELVTPLAKRMDTLVGISKQALWETRNYMFNLKPLMSGSTNLTQMLTNQVREFQAISEIETQLVVTGTEITFNGDQRRAERYARVGAAVFRIVQEALTNAYKHADATQLLVQLQLSPEHVAIEVSDNGNGMHSAYYRYDLTDIGERERIYSGHGLRGMRERAEELGGTFAISPLPERGVRIHVRIPI